MDASALPEIESPVAPSAVLERLDSAARRGKLPGFSGGKTEGDRITFELTDFGAPFESRLLGRAFASGEVSRIAFDPPRLKPLFPWVFAVILVLTIWPGGWLTDSMIRSYWDWYSSRPWWVTYAWYMPLTVPFCPLAMRSALRKSRASARVEVAALAAKVAAATGGRIVAAAD